MRYKFAKRKSWKISSALFIYLFIQNNKKVLANYKELKKICKRKGEAEYHNFAR